MFQLSFYLLSHWFLHVIVSHMHNFRILKQVLYVQGGHAAKQMATTNVLAGLEGRLRVLSRLRSALIRRNEGKYEHLYSRYETNKRISEARISDQDEKGRDLGQDGGWWFSESRTFLPKHC